MKQYIIFLLTVKQIPLIVLLNFSFILFIIGLVGIIWNKKNFLVLILCIEIMFFSISLNFIFFSIYLYSILGQIFSLLIVTSAAAETAVGLSLLVAASRLGNKVSYESLVILWKLKKSKKLRLKFIRFT
jgi:NADH-quinone oxidoreductase subunit K